MPTTRQRITEVGMMRGAGSILECIGIGMAFKQTKGSLTVEACVLPSPGNMFKGAVCVTRVSNDKQIKRVTGRGCGRPMRDSADAMELAEVEARRMLGL